MQNATEQKTKAVQIEHQLYHCPGCSKVIRGMMKAPLAPERLGALHRAVMHWCEQCRCGEVALQRFNGVGWDFLGKPFKTQDRNYLEGLCSRVERASDPAAEIALTVAEPVVSATPFVLDQD